MADFNTISDHLAGDQVAANAYINSLTSLRLSCEAMVAAADAAPPQTVVISRHHGLLTIGRLERALRVLKTTLSATAETAAQTNEVDVHEEAVPTMNSIGKELWDEAQKFLEQNIHPNVIIQAYRMALDDMIHWAEIKYSKPVDVKNEEELAVAVKACLSTKMMSLNMDLAVKISLDVVRSISVDKAGYHEIDIKRYCRIEKIPGGEIDDSRVIKGVVFNKDIVDSEMKRRIEKPRIILLDCSLGDDRNSSGTPGEDETEIRKQCDEIIALKPDLVITEEDISHLAQYFLVRDGITALRRLKKTDNNRLARATGATICHDTKDLTENNIGTKADLFEITKIGDEYFTFITSEESTAATIVLPGPSKDIINEVERNLQDAVNCVCNVLLNPRVVPGGGAVEMALANAITKKSESVEGVLRKPYAAIARALEVIPRTLIQNCGGSDVRKINLLRAKHADDESNLTWGVNGATGELVDIKELNIWDPLTVRLQVLKTAIETSIMLLRIDDIVSGTKKMGDVNSK